MPRAAGASNARANLRGGSRRARRGSGGGEAAANSGTSKGVRERPVTVTRRPDARAIPRAIQEAFVTYSGREGLGTQWVAGPEIPLEQRRQQGREDIV